MSHISSRSRALAVAVTALASGAPRASPRRILMLPHVVGHRLVRDAVGVDHGRAAEPRAPDRPLQRPPVRQGLLHDPRRDARGLGLHGPRRRGHREALQLEHLRRPRRGAVRAAAGDRGACRTSSRWRRSSATAPCAGFLNDWLYSTRPPPMPGHPDWTVTPVGAPAPLRAESAASVLLKR